MIQRPWNMERVTCSQPTLLQGGYFRVLLPNYKPELTSPCGGKMQRVSTSSGKEWSTGYYSSKDMPESLLLLFLLCFNPLLSYTHRLCFDSSTVTKRSLRKYIFRQINFRAKRN